MSERISITRALTELKLLDGRINTKIDRLDFVGLTQKKQGETVLGTTRTRQDFESNAKADYQSVLDLIRRRQVIKSAVIQSNAATRVRVGDLEMTVAEAIDFKDAIKYEKLLLKRLSHGLTWATTEKEKADQEIGRKVEQMLNQNLGSDRKASSDDYNTIAKPFLEANSLNVVDPLNADLVSKVLEDKISKFEAEIDMTLAESNARTEIELN